MAAADAAVAAARGVLLRRLEQRLRGDLDTIVLTALRPEVGERYGSALEMARDIENHLDGLPITARPPTLAYRARKFLSRHRWMAPVAAAVVAAVGLYVATLVRHGNQLEAERNAARQQAERAERVRDVLVGVFRSSDPWDGEGAPASGSATTLQTLEAGTRRARSDLAGEPGLQIDVLTAIGDVYVGLGHPDRAHALLEETLQLRRATHGARSSSSAIGLLKLGRAIAAEDWYDTASADSSISPTPKRGRDSSTRPNVISSKRCGLPSRATTFRRTTLPAPTTTWPFSTHGSNATRTRVSPPRRRCRSAASSTATNIRRPPGNSWATRA